MSYQKPITPQRFDKPVYELQQPKKKTEKKRPLGRKTRRADVQAQPGSKLSLVTVRSNESRGNIKSRGGKKSVGSTKSVSSKKRPSSVKPARRVSVRKRAA